MTIQLTNALANALVNANKSFDILVLPNRNHEFDYDPYFIKRQFGYLVLHLKGSLPPTYIFNVPRCFGLTWSCQMTSPQLPGELRDRS